MAAARSFGSPVFVFLAFTVLFCHLIFSDLHQRLTKITAQSFTENQTSPSSCSERKVIVQLGNLIRVSLVKHGFRRSRVGFLKWSKHGQTMLLVAGHDPPMTSLSTQMCLRILVHNLGIESNLFLPTVTR